MAQKRMTLKDAKARIRELEAQDVLTYRMAYEQIAKANQTRFMASGVILSLTALGNKELVEPVMIADGLSAATIAAIQDDIRRSLELRLAFCKLPEKKA